MNKITIVIPYYNQDQFLENCLTSIVNQTYTNWEAIVVDDASTDSSKKILKFSIWFFDIDNLFVKEAYVGKSIVMKRYRPRAKGRASPIKKPYSRLTIILKEKKGKK